MGLLIAAWLLAAALDDATPKPAKSDLHAVQAYLRHGDAAGPCAGGAAPGEGAR
jgi:hypothetical protein